jgi:hypothetical protein
LKGHKYGRDGESLGPLTDNEYDTIKSQSPTVDWQAKVIKVQRLMIYHKKP